MCPKCKQGGISVRMVLAAKPLGSYSISGAQDKVVATPRAEATCSNCDFRVLGYLEDPEYGPDGIFTGGHFVAENI